MVFRRVFLPVLLVLSITFLMIITVIILVIFVNFIDMLVVFPMDINLFYNSGWRILNVL